MLFPLVGSLEVLCCAVQAHRLFTLNIIHQRKTGRSLSLDPHLMQTQDCVVAIIFISYDTMLPLFTIRKTSFRASLMKSHSLHPTCVLNPILFYIDGELFLFLFTECQEADFILLQKCPQCSWWLACKTAGGVILTEAFVSKCSSTSSALRYG